MTTQSTTEQLPASFDETILAVREHEVRLICSHCSDCGRKSFPPSIECPYCGGTVQPSDLPTSGVVYSHTTLLHPLTVFPVPTVIVQVELEPDVLATGPLLDGEAVIDMRVDLVPNVVSNPDDDLGPYTGFGWVGRKGSGDA